MSREFPGVEVEPVIRNLDLISIHNFLLEDTVSVAKPISPRRIVQSGHTVKEACRKSAKTTVSESSVVLL